MATAPFICDVEGSEKSVRTSVSSHQLRHRVCSYTLLQVLLGVLAVFVLALTGGVIWMKWFQDCPEKFWTVSFTGTSTSFTSPKTQKYTIIGSVFTKGNHSDCGQNLFKLQKILLNTTSKSLEKTEIKRIHVSEIFVEYDVELWKEATLSIQLNCGKDLKVDEDKSKLFIYQQNSC